MTHEPSLLLSLGKGLASNYLIELCRGRALLLVSLPSLTSTPSLPPYTPFQTWLMDGATYPIIVIITFAVTMCSSFTA